MVLDGLFPLAERLATQYGYLAVFVFLFLETSMLFPFLPSEVVVPLAAGAVVTGAASIVGFGLAAAGGGVLGGLFAYYAFGGGANRLVEHVHVDGDPDRARKWFRRYGEHSVLWGRLLPFLRSVISIPAGVAGMNVPKFALYTGAGTFAFNAAVAALVYYGKQQSIYQAALDYAVAHPALAGGLVLAAAALGGAVWWWGLWPDVDLVGENGDEADDAEVGTDVD